MFPTELELEQHRQDMIRTAENQRLVKFVQAGNDHAPTQPTLWQRLRVRLSVAQTEPGTTALPMQQPGQKAIA